MLPGIANLALYEISSHLVGDFDTKDAFIINGIFESIFRVRVERWRTRIFVVATNAADGFIVVLDIFDGGGHVVYFNLGLLVAFVFFAARTSASHYLIVVVNRMGIFGGLRGERSATGRFDGRAGLRKSSCASFSASRCARCSRRIMRLWLRSSRSGRPTI